MSTTPAGQQSSTASLQTVLSYLTALNNEDFGGAANYLNDDLRFVGVLGSREGKEACLTDIRQLKIKYAVHKTFVDDDDVCVICDFQLAGVSVFGCGWYHLINGKISFIRVVFDPRPVLEKSGK